MGSTPAELANKLIANTEVQFSEDVRNSRFVTPIAYLRRTTRHKSPLLPELIESRKVLLELMRSTFRSFPANPNKKTLIAQFDATYANDGPRTPHSPREHRGFIAIASLLTDVIRSEDYVAFVGARGSGKTALVNKWLNDYTKTVLEDDLRLAWFRIDAEKVYGMQDNGVFVREKATLANYLRVHSVYVFFRYSGVLADTVGESDQFNRVKSALELTISRTDLNQWKRAIVVLRKHFAKISDPDSDFASERFVASAFRKENADLFDWSIKAWAILTRVLNKENVGILCIIDGIDNVSWSKENELYTRMCADAKEFMAGLRSITGNKNSKLLFVSRPETIPELEIQVRRHGFSHPIGVEVQFACVELANSDARTVLKRKVDATINNPLFAEHRERFHQKIEKLRRADADIETSTKLLEGMVKVGNGYLGQIVEDINRLERYIINAGGEVSPHPLDEEQLIGLLFDNDLRSLLDCFVMLNRARSIAARQKVVGAAEPSRYLEYLLLAGKNYLESAPFARERRYQKIPRGEIFPNIFWYDTKDALEKPAMWHGLSGYRMLQCAENMDSITGADLVYMLRELFGYCQDVLIEHLEAFVAYGLLNVEFHAQRKPVYCPEAEKEHRYKALLSISDKGRLIKALSLSYIDWVYFMALDTPMHLKEVEDTKRVRFYVHPFAIDQRMFGFLSAYCPTVTTFARHLMYYNREEHVTLRKNFPKMGDRFAGAVIDNEVLLRWFELPKTFVSILRSELTSALNGRRAEMERFARPEHLWESFEQELIGTFPSG